MWVDERRLNLSMNTQANTAIKQLLLLAALVIFMMWLLKPYVHNNTDLRPQSYYRLGSTCLLDFESITQKYGYTLTNTYAKKVSSGRSSVLIRARYRQEKLQPEIECIYENTKLVYISVDSQILSIQG